jgi:hypothetical protein
MGIRPIKYFVILTTLLVLISVDLHLRLILAW